MKISVDELKEKLIQAAKQLVTEEEARYFAEEAVETYIRKMPRNHTIKTTISDLKHSLAHRDTPIKYVVDLPSFVSIDFQGQGAEVYIKRIHDLLENRASIKGLAMIAFTNSQSMHILHTWVQGLAKRGLLAIAMCNGGPGAVIPFNGTRGIFGPNPLAFGLPGKNGEIHCIDMAMAEVPFFEVMDAYKNKDPLRQGSVVDNQGQPTTDPEKAMDLSTSKTDPIANILPIGGGYKGYYLAYLMEIMTSALIGTLSSPEMSNDFVAEEHGALLLAFSPKAMGSEANFSRTVNAIHQALKNQTPKTSATIRIPGEENNRRFAEAEDFIEIDDSIAKKLGEL